ncbi:hypothetical protein E2C01_087202 [Portunus trituberculatus]|uniref:Uncharacterized protein n=1 Tax=Portunus trituberculatus TaxID=210409 RepID=A0A5B7J5Z7_PORTR|nr:hypothetical protein [Portunus trituberculatus]
MSQRCGAAAERRARRAGESPLCTEGRPWWGVAGCRVLGAGAGVGGVMAVRPKLLLDMAGQRLDSSFASHC